MWSHSEAEYCAHQWVKQEKKNATRARVLGDGCPLAVGGVSLRGHGILANAKHRMVDGPAVSGGSKC